jgi:hypothetical protein
MYSLANANGTLSSSRLSQLEVSRCRLAWMSVLGLHHADCASSPSGTGLVDVTSRGATAEFAGTGTAEFAGKGVEKAGKRQVRSVHEVIAWGLVQGGSDAMQARAHSLGDGRMIECGTSDSRHARRLIQLIGAAVGVCTRAPVYAECLRCENVPHDDANHVAAACSNSYYSS